MRKNTKGFTLVELLAVIVILAIIALIAVPIVMNVIGNARKSAAIESFRGYMDAVEKTIIRDSLKTTSELPSKDANGCYNLKELDTKVKVKGDKPVIDDEDTLCMEKGKVKSVSEVTISGYKLEYKDGKILVNGKSTETTKPKTYTVTYNANGGSGSMEATTNEIVANTFTRTNYEFKEWNTKQDGTGETYTTTSTVSSDLTLYAIWVNYSQIKCNGNSTCNVGNYINYNPTTNQKCENPTSTTGTKTGCMKWYVIKDNGSSVDVILDHNTTATVAYETSGTYKEYAQASIKTQVDSDTTGWASGLNPRLITANEVATIVGNTSWNSSTATSSQYFYFGSLSTTRYSSQTEEQKARQRSFAWLFDYTEGCTSYGCNTADSSTDGYWTSSPVSGNSYFAWFVYDDGTLSFGNVVIDYGFGVRPVITLSKSVISS